MSTNKLFEIEIFFTMRKKLGVSQPSVSISVKRGEKIGKAEQFWILDCGLRIVDLLYRYALSHLIKLTEYLKSKIENLKSQIYEE